jgi:hypothetical protein
MRSFIRKDLPALHRNLERAHLDVKKDAKAALEVQTEEERRRWGGRAPRPESSPPRAVLPIVAPAFAASVTAIVVLVVAAASLAFSAPCLEILRNRRVTAPTRSFGPDRIRSHMMIIREEMNVNRIDHLGVPRRVLLPAVRLAVGWAAAKVVDIGIEAKMERNIRPALAAPPKIDHHCRRDASALRHVEHDGNFVGRESLLLDDDYVTLGNLVIVSDRKVKAPEAIA